MAKHNDNQKNNTEISAKLASKGNTKTAARVPTLKDCIRIGSVSEANTASLTANLTDFRETATAAINALEGMYTNVKDSKLDEKIVDGIMQIEGDACMKETEQANRIIQKNDSDNQWIVWTLLLVLLIVGDGDLRKCFQSGKFDISQIVEAATNLLPSKLRLK